MGELNATIRLRKVMARAMLPQLAEKSWPSGKARIPNGYHEHAAYAQARPVDGDDCHNPAPVAVTPGPSTLLFLTANPSSCMPTPLPPPTAGFRQLYDLAAAAGGRVEHDVMHLPARIGTGYLRLLRLEPGLKAIVHDCTLAREMTLQRLADPQQPETLFISFNTFQALPAAPAYLPSVQLASSDIGFTAVLPAHMALFTLGIAIDKVLLRSWLNPADGPPPVLLISARSVALDAPLTPEMQHLLADFTAAQHPAFLPAFYYKTKLQQLLYWVLREVGDRAAPAPALYTANVEKIYQVRTALVASLSTPPSLATLAQAVGLSVTTLKQLFRQVFGTSPYAYLQQARMAEAKRLLEYLSVAEVGYRLGFTNLSHFARLFKKHHQVTPKKHQLLPRQ